MTFGYFRSILINMVENGNFFGDGFQRISLGDPSQQEIEFMLGEFQASYRRRLLKIYGNKRRSTRDLTEFRENELARGHTVSKPSLVALFISVTTAIFFKEDIHKMAKGYEGFIVTRFAFDNYFGVKEVLASVIGAETEIRGQTEQKASDHLADIDDQFPGLLSISDQAQKYLDAKDQNKKDAQLLTEDPTGFQLIDRSLENLSQKLAHIEDYPFCKEYVLAGGKLARDAYKILYRITE